MRSRMPPEYAIPDDPDTNKMDAAYLRTCLGIRTMPGEEPTPLPVAVRRAHYDMARSLSLLGAMGPTGMDATQLAVVIALALRDPDMEMPKRNGGSEQVVAEASAPKPAPAPEPEPEEQKQAVPVGEPVFVTLDGQERAGFYTKRGPGGRLVVVVDGEERFLRPGDVRFPENGEAAEVNQEVEV